MCLFSNVIYLPVDFSKANGFKIGEMILRDDKGRSWKAHLNRSKEKYFYLGLGLRPFLVANGMKEGDAFKFELVENERDKPPIINFSFLESKPVKSHNEAKCTQKEGSVLGEEDGRPYFKRGNYIRPSRIAKALVAFNNLGNFLLTIMVIVVSTTQVCKVERINQ
ncbi:hypothetical protein L1887_19637 [Cichorium endivia]|nr:hypothetical protein L1887_19637 [Cichorium endivia]